MTKLSELVKVKRRYCRSINLERDTEISDSIIGYIPTSRATDALERFFRSFKTPNSIRSWTITGSYGSGKSAFAHFLSSICAPENSKIRKNATSILKSNSDSKAFASLANNIISKKGLIRAIVTAQREPISVTILRALYRGASNFWQYGKGRRPKELKEIKELYVAVKDGRNIDNTILIDLLTRLSKASKSGLLLIIDELGKSLEFAAQNQNLDDLYLLQQLAELPSGKTDPKIFIYGLLHQSFSDYSHGLAVAQRNEWSKIQGRFEDISYVESSERMMRLIGQAITKKSGFDASSWAKIWKTNIKTYNFSNSISKDDIASIYPLHPLSAIILPILCSKFSQNDRTLFNFLASREPKSFTQFLKETEYIPDDITTFKLYKLYDYFVESAGISFSMRTKSQKWIEIQSRLHDAKHVDPDARLALKTIGLLNIVSTSGALRASRNTVLLSMCDNPKNKKEITHWNTIIETLLHEGFITWRKQVDELRIWEGSDFDVEREIMEQSQSQNISVANLLNENFALSPIVVQRHSYQTGTLRYFERRYCDSIDSLISAKCENSDSDGLICYWLGSRDDIQSIEMVPQETSDHKPLIIIGASELKALQIACNEYVTIKKIAKNSIQLQTDGVARREVNQRVLISQRFLEEAIARSFDFSVGQIACWGQGDIIEIDSSSSFQSYLSSICDAHYYKGPFLWNELINRRDLTTQGSAARKKLIDAMLNQEGQERLGMEGFGPECSMFESIFRETDIYVKNDGQWIFSEPGKSSGLYYAWKAIENFCKSANRKQQNVKELYNLLDAPPYGVKKGVIPILFLSVILFNKDYISLYLDGSFIPAVGPEHFELFVKKPERFSVKYFEMSGINAQIFFELEKIFNPNRNDIDPSFRNATILSIVKPLVGFISKLPKYTLHTAEGLSSDSKKVRKALLEAKEPDKLIFYDLPKIFGLKVHIDTSKTDNGIGKQYREKLIQVLKELQSSYEKLIVDNKQLLHEAFGVRSDIAKLREDLRVRSSYLVSHVMEDQLRRFIFACTSDDDDETSWIETVLMIVADKPPRSWTDDDASLFETKLYDLARRFRNLESLQKDRNIKHNSDGFDVRKLTITKPDGNEIQQLVWIDRNNHEKIQSITDHILDHELIKDDINLQQAVATALIERIFGKKDDQHSHVIKEAQVEYKRG